MTGRWVSTRASRAGRHAYTQVYNLSAGGTARRRGSSSRGRSEGGEGVGYRGYLQLRAPHSPTAAAASVGKCPRRSTTSSATDQLAGQRGLSWAAAVNSCSWGEPSRRIHRHVVRIAGSAPPTTWSGTAPCPISAAGSPVVGRRLVASAVLAENVTLDFAAFGSRWTDKSSSPRCQQLQPRNLGANVSGWELTGTVLLHSLSASGTSGRSAHRTNLRQALLRTSPRGSSAAAVLSDSPGCCRAVPQRHGGFAGDRAADRPATSCQQHCPLHATRLRLRPALSSQRIRPFGGRANADLAAAATCSTSAMPSRGTGVDITSLGPPPAVNQGFRSTAQRIRQGLVRLLLDPWLRRLQRATAVHLQGLGEHRSHRQQLDRVDAIRRVAVKQMNRAIKRRVRGLQFRFKAGLAERHQRRSAAHGRVVREHGPGGVIDRTQVPKRPTSCLRPDRETTGGASAVWKLYGGSAPRDRQRPDPLVQGPAKRRAGSRATSITGLQPVAMHDPSPARRDINARGPQDRHLRHDEIFCRSPPPRWRATPTSTRPADGAPQDRERFHATTPIRRRKLGTGHRTAGQRHQRSARARGRPAGRHAVAPRQQTTWTSSSNRQRRPEIPSSFSSLPLQQHLVTRARWPKGGKALAVGGRGAERSCADFRRAFGAEGIIAIRSITTTPHLCCDVLPEGLAEPDQGRAQVRDALPCTGALPRLQPGAAARDRGPGVEGLRRRDPRIAPAALNYEGGRRTGGYEADRKSAARRQLQGPARK